MCETLKSVDTSSGEAPQGTDPESNQTKVVVTRPNNKGDLLIKTFEKLYNVDTNS